MPLVVAAVGVVCVVLGFSRIGSDYRYQRVAGETMSPELRPGEQIVTTPVRPAEVTRGEVYTVDSPWTMTGPVLQRVMALGGDHFACVAGRLTLNGQPLDEPESRQLGSCSIGFDVTVPQGRAFLMGDRRFDAFDSRLNLDDQQGTVDLAKVDRRVVWHSGAKASPPGTLVGAAVLTGVGFLVFVAGLITSIVAAVVRRRRRRRAVAQPDTGAAERWPGRAVA
ncbi:signal peptidase I [Kitasatospora sp. NPDC101235]|uniref:signal peptidase I n=1 Tax=Kitasatospora sp. NPDC101235 TaxID=3364101 RepID=UPI0038147FF0